MTAARDELAQVILAAAKPIMDMSTLMTDANDSWLVADALIKAGYTKPRVVTTAAELDACSLDAVVVDRAGCPRTKRVCNSLMSAGWTNAGNSPLRSTELADGHEMTVVFEGRA